MASASSKPRLKDFVLRAQNAYKTAPEFMQTASRKIKVLVIAPPTTGAVKSLLPQVDDDGEGIGYKPPLGIMYIASFVQERSAHEVKVIDAVAEQMSFEDIANAAEAFQPDVIGLSAWTDFWYPTYNTAKLLKDRLPDSHICVGGPHVGIYPTETLEAPFIDSVIGGDGEVPFLFLCNMVANKQIDNSMQGLHFKKFGVKPAPDTFYVHGDLDELPIPDRTMLPIELYGSVLSKGDRVTTMVTSRGCPHSCTFCKLNFQKTLARSAENVVEEFREIQKLGIREVEIYDDTFTWGKKRLREICETLIKENIQVEWAVRDRVSSADPEMFALMHKAGCRRIHFGIESGVQKVIDRMQKRITIDQARNAVREAKKAGLTVLTYFMFGNLDETIEDMEATVKFCLELDAHFSEFSITIPYAGTEMYLDALRKGIISEDYWKAYAINPTPNFVTPQLIEENATLKQMMEIRNRAIKRFYFRPGYLINQLRSLSGLMEFVRKIRMGARLAMSVYVR